RRGVAGKQMKSLTYCVDAVLDAAEEEAEAAAGTGPAAAPKDASAESFSAEQVRRYLERNRERLSATADRLAASEKEISLRCMETAEKLAAVMPILDTPGRIDLEDLERRLTILEDKLTASLLAGAKDDLLLEIQRELDRQLSPYRRKMSGAQLS